MQGKLPLSPLVLLSHSSLYRKKKSTRPPAVGEQEYSYSDEGVESSRIEIRIG